MLYVNIWIRNETNLCSTKFSTCISRFRGINHTHFKLFIQGNIIRILNNLLTLIMQSLSLRWEILLRTFRQINLFQSKLKCRRPEGERETEGEPIFGMNYSKRSGNKINQTSILCSHSSSDLHELRDKPRDFIHRNRNSLLGEFETIRIQQSIPRLYSPLIVAVS